MNRDDLKNYFRKGYESIIKEQDDPFATDEGGDEEEAAEEEASADDASDDEGEKDA